MTAPCAIEYILVTRWRGGKKGGQNRVCACDTRDRGVNKKLKPEHPSENGLSEEAMDSSYWLIHGQAIILTWKQLSL